MKKILSVILLATMIFFVQEKVFAQDIYCGTFSDGNNAYLMTETIRYISYGDSTYEEGIDCRVKSVKNNSVTYIDYHFDISEGGTVSFTNSRGSSGQFGGVLLRNGSPYHVESEIFENAYRLKPPKRVG